ncbi:response regulator transcription factor [Flavihumibacter sp. RY-1]|uniref:Response regulator transcription factor n=1 Tax=Flavihumibacter fluminis TaxID=2909236 RepID=A0ABS9BJX7_9BACT|nr:response regulator transcription factor [Flavihumibacter fluminis]MCF1715519.1 response regulator transcription factor [Flavihumibacter fluminis]
MKKSIQILIYEDNVLLRESLNNLLALTGEYEVLASFPDCSDVLNQVRQLDPDVILMDIDLPGINGIEAVKLIRGFNPQVQIIMLTVFDDNTHVFDAMYAGANGYLLKKYISDKLLHAIQEVLQGGAPMSPSIARMIITSLQQPTVAAKDYSLTNREKEILQLLSSGNSFKMIAAELSISLDTVRTHIKHIYDKLHVRSQIEAVSKAIQEKLVK